MTLAIRRDRPDLALMARTELERRHANIMKSRAARADKRDQDEMFCRHWAAINDMAGGTAPDFIARHFRCPAHEIRWWHLCLENVEVDRFQRAALQELRRATEAAILRGNDPARERALRTLDRELAAPLLGPLPFPAIQMKEAA